MLNQLLRPTFTKNIYQHYIQKGKSLNIFGASGVGKSRFIDDLKLLVDDDTHFVTLNMRELRTNYDKFIKRLEDKLDIDDGFDTIEQVLAKFARKKGKKVLVIDHFEYLFEENHDKAFNFDFFDQLNSFKNSEDVSLVILSTLNYRHYHFYKNDELTTSPLDIEVMEITPLMHKEIESELKQKIDKDLGFELLATLIMGKAYPCYLIEFIVLEIVFGRYDTDEFLEMISDRWDKKTIKHYTNNETSTLPSESKLINDYKELDKIMASHHRINHYKKCYYIDKTMAYYNRKKENILLRNKIDTFLNSIKEKFTKKDSIEFSIFVPTRILLNDDIIVNVWVYLPKEYKKITEIIDRTSSIPQKNIGTALGISIRRESLLTLKLGIKNLNIEEEIRTIEWKGTPQNTMFSVSIPSTVDNRNCLGTLSIFYQGMVISIISFNMIIDKVGDKNKEYFPIPIERFTPKTAFASYSSKDKKDVLSRIQGMKKILPNLDIFIDLISLQSGEIWEETLYEHVPNKDIFYLFWSTSASKSKWVEKEWKLALEKRGLNYINPVPLEEPKYAPPPKELSSLHFSDMYLSYLK